jgi:hypothetical protein
MTVIETDPVSMEYVDAFDNPPTKSAIEKDVRDLYVGHLKLNIINDYVDSLSNATVKRKYGNHLRITRVTISKSAVSDLTPALRDSTPDAREFLAETFGQELSSNDHVALLPYVKDMAIGNKMALRFANGNVFNLTIPQTDYALSLHVKKFRKIAFKKRPYATTWIYAAYIRLKLFEPMSGQTYLDSDFRDGVVKLIPSNQTEVMNWPVYQEALLKLFGDVTHSFLKSDSNWARKSSNSPDIHKQIANTRKVLQSCR